MRQLILICLAAAALSVSAMASPKEMEQLYTEFQKSRDLISSAAFTKKDFIKQFKKIDKELDHKYQSYKSFEKEELTSKGNQMAYDLELLEPLRLLANSKMTKDDCAQALHSNELNANEDDEKENKKIQGIILSVCR